jgi:hypothetical protein
MSKYSAILYNQGFYGQKSRLAFSVEPISAVALNYTDVMLNWSAPLGGYTAFRILRNQDGYSDTVEDGIIIYEEFDIDSGSGSVSISTFTDGKDNPSDPSIVGGKFVFYRVWVLKSADNVWYPAGDTFTLMPSSHPTFGKKLAVGKNKEVLLTTQDKLMNLLPRMYSSMSYSPIDEVDKNSDLYRYLSGFAFTLDEFLTMADTLLPNFDGGKSNPAAIPARAYSLGLVQEPHISISSQKRMLREALYMYSHKGSLTGLTTMVETLTGYGSNITTSGNLMLSNQDATFYGGLGYWLPIGNCTIALEDVNPVTSETLSIDKTYSAKIVVSTGGAAVSNGADYPVTRGVPVTEGTEYGFSFYVQKSTGTGTVTPSITWYDFKGNVLSTSTGSNVTATTTWAKPVTLFTAIAPEGAVYASVAVKFNATGTYYLDMVQFALSYETDYSESRAVNVFLQPTKSNYIQNPSLEVDTTGWSASVGTISRVATDTPPQDLTGGHVLQLASGSISVTTSSVPGAFPSNSYATFSAYSRIAPTAGTSETLSATITATETINVYAYSITGNVMRLSVSFNESVQVGSTITVSDIATGLNGTYVVSDISQGDIYVPVTHANVTSTAVSGFMYISSSTVGTFLISDVWTRNHFTGYIPAEFQSVNTTVSVRLSGTLSHGVQIDSSQLEANVKPTDYFDGSFGTERDALWAGTPQESTSYLYANKIINVTRLAAELPNFLPQNTAYVISTYSGIEYSGITD